MNKLCCILFALTFLLGCHGAVPSAKDASSGTGMSTVAGSFADRLNAMWNGYDFADSTEANRDKGEQLFSNFICALQYADSLSASIAVSSFYGRAYACESSREWCNAIVDHYLVNPDSPFRNDVVYAHFLSAFISHCDDDAQLSRARYMLDLVSRNQPGAKAADFSFVDRNGTTGNLYSLESDFILLIFNDPACDRCQEVMPALLADPLLASEGLLVLSVYPYDDAALWRECATPMPGNWLDVHDAGSEIIDGRLYHLPAMPSLYLLDSEKNVLLKDAPLQFVRDVLMNGGSMKE